MAYVVTRVCLEGKFTKCVDVCPVDAFREGPDMLYIDPDVCIDCNACLAECPLRAIYPQHAVPEAMQGDIALNAIKSKEYPVISESCDSDNSAREGKVQSPKERTSGDACTYRFAVVGAGPSGFYATEELLKQVPQARVDLFERLPTPFGLLRYGVAPDHPKIKSIADSFDKIGRVAQVRFFGNVEVGKHISRNELLEHYDAVLYATGGSANRQFDLPGADLANIHGASTFVGWYNGHPDYQGLQVDLSGETVVVVGVGNVALDVARMLTLPIDELERTDIADYALEALRNSQIREVCLVARRGPVQAAFTPKELRQLLDLKNVNIQVDAGDLQLDAASEEELADPLNTEARQNMELLREAQARSQQPDVRIIRFIFKVSPTSFEGTVEGVRSVAAVINQLVPNEKSEVSVRSTGQVLRLTASLVINATGYQGLPVEGLAFDQRRAVIANREGRVLTEQQLIAPREYVAGWIKRGASGVVGSNKQCAAETVRHLVADLNDAAPSVAVRHDMASLMRARKVEFVSYEDWLLLDQHEREQGKVQGRPRCKETGIAAMLGVIRANKAGVTNKSNVITPQPLATVSTAEKPAANQMDVLTHFRTCSLCEAMCGIKIDYQGDKILSIAGDPEDPHSRGHICPKGYALQDLHNDPDRLKTPMKRVGDQWIPVGWDAAFDEVAQRLARVQTEFGNDTVAAYWGNPTAHNLGIMLTIEKFRSVLRTRNLFTASSLDQMPHQLVSWFMYGHSQLFTIPDIDHTDYLLMIGANPAVSNGSLMSAGAVLERLQHITQRGGKILLIDPRRTETALYVSEHQFIQPGTDALFLLGLIQVILRKGLSKPGRLINMVDSWDQLTVFCDHLPLTRIAEKTGISVEDIERIATEFAAAERAVCYGRMGISAQEFGALNHWLIQLLNILTGNLDREGGMMFTTPAFDLVNMSSGGGFDRYRSRVRGRAEFCREFPTAILAEEILTPGEGQVRAFVSIAGNPVLSSPNGRQLEKALEQLDFMVAVDFYLNETTRHAHIILPPTGPLEHEQYDIVFNMLAVRNVAKYAAPMFPRQEGTKSDWDIFNALVKRIQRLKMQRAPLIKRLKHFAAGQLSELLTPERLVDLALRTGPYGTGLNPLKVLTPFKKRLNLFGNKRPELFGSKGLDLAMLQKYPHGLDLGPLKPSLPQRLFTKNKRIQLMPAALEQDLKRLSERYNEQTRSPGLVLIGRRDLRTNNSWMHNSLRLVKGKDRCALFVHPEDAKAQGVQDRDQVRLVSAQGELTVTVKLTQDIKPGVVSLPHGWGHHRPGMRLSTAQANAGVSINDITDDQVVDELSGNAVLNGIPVHIELLKPL